VRRIVCAAVVLLCSIVAAAPAGAGSDVDELVASECLDPGAIGEQDAETLSNRLIAETIPDPVVVGRDEPPKQYEFPLESRFDESQLEELGEGSNFELNASLSVPDGVRIEDGIVAQASPDGDREVVVRVCIDPSPGGAPLDVGTYEGRIALRTSGCPRRR
jgi:hypothetical protein